MLCNLWWNRQFFRFCLLGCLFNVILTHTHTHTHNKLNIFWWFWGVWLKLEWKPAILGSWIMKRILSWVNLKALKAFRSKIKVNLHLILVCKYWVTCVMKSLNHNLVTCQDSSSIMLSSFLLWKNILCWNRLNPK